MKPEIKLFVEPTTQLANQIICEYLSQRAEESLYVGESCDDEEKHNLIHVGMKVFIFFIQQHVTHHLSCRFFASVDNQKPVELFFIDDKAQSTVGETAVVKLLSTNLLSPGETQQVIANAVKPWHKCEEKSPRKTFGRPPRKFAPTHRDCRTH
jgi:hypothetical protein